MPKPDSPKGGRKTRKSTFIIDDEYQTDHVLDVQRGGMAKAKWSPAAATAAALKATLDETTAAAARKLAAKKARQEEAAVAEAAAAVQREEAAAAAQREEAAEAAAAAEREESESRIPFSPADQESCIEILSRLQTEEKQWKLVSTDSYSSLTGVFSEPLVKKCLRQNGYTRSEFTLVQIKEFLNMLLPSEQEAKVLSLEKINRVTAAIDSNTSMTVNQKMRKKDNFQKIAISMGFQLGTTIDDTDDLDERLSKTSEVPGEAPVAEGKDIFSDRAHERSIASIDINAYEDPKEFAKQADKKLKTQRIIMRGERILCPPIDGKAIVTSDGRQRYCFKQKPETVGSSRFQLQARQDMAVHRFVQYCADEKGILLVHSVGTGKTITSLTMALNSFSWNDTETVVADPFMKREGKSIPNPEYKWRKIVLVVPGSLFRNFQEELKVNIPNITDLVELDVRSPGNLTGDEKIVPPLAKIRAKFNGKYFSMIGYKYGSINQWYLGAPDPDKGNLSKIFTNAVVVFDEAHRLFRSIQEGGATNTLDIFLKYRYLLNTKRYILMTGTPYSKGLTDTIALLRLFDCNSRTCDTGETCERVVQCATETHNHASKFFVKNYGNYWGPIKMLGQYTPDEQLHFSQMLFGKFLQTLDLVPYDLLWEINAGPIRIPIGKKLVQMYQSCKQILENRKKYRATLFDSLFGDELEPILFYFQAVQEGKSVAYAQQKMWERAQKQAKILTVAIIPGAAAGAAAGYGVIKLGGIIGGYIGGLIMGYIPQVILNVIGAIAIFKPLVVSSLVVGGAYIGVKTVVKIIQWFKWEPKLPKDLVELVAKILIAKPEEQERLLKEAKTKHQREEEKYTVEEVPESNLPADALNALAAARMNDENENVQTGGLSFENGLPASNDEWNDDDDEEESKQENFKEPSAKIPLPYAKYKEALKYFNANERTPFKNIKQTFRRLALAEHPNKGGTTEKWVPIQDAFSLLTLFYKGKLELIQEGSRSSNTQIKYDIYTKLVKLFPNEDERTNMLTSMTQVLASDKFKGYAEKNDKEYESLSTFLKDDSTFANLAELALGEFKERYNNMTSEEIFESVSADLNEKDFSLEYLENSIKAGSILDAEPNTPSKNAAAPTALLTGGSNGTTNNTRVKGKNKSFTKNKKEVEYSISQKNSKPEMYSSGLEDDDTPIELASDEVLNLITKDLDFIYEDYPHLIDNVIPTFSIDCASREGYSKSKAIVEFLGATGVMSKYEAAQKFLTDEEKKQLTNRKPEVQTGGATVESIVLYINEIESIKVKFGELNKVYTHLKKDTDWFTNGIEGLDSIKKGLEILKTIPEHSRPTHMFSEVSKAIDAGILKLNELDKDTIRALKPGIDYVNGTIVSILDEVKIDTGKEIAPITLSQFKETQSMQNEILKLFHSSLQKFVFSIKVFVDEHLAPPSRSTVNMSQKGGMGIDILAASITPELMRSIVASGVSTLDGLTADQALSVMQSGASQLSSDILGELSRIASEGLTKEVATERLAPIVAMAGERGASIMATIANLSSSMSLANIPNFLNKTSAELLNYTSGMLMPIYTYDFYNGITIQYIMGIATGASRAWSIAGSIGSALATKKLFDKLGWSNVGTAVSVTMVASTAFALSWPVTIAVGVGMYISRKAKSSGNITPLDIRVKNWFDKIHNVSYKVNLKKFSDDSKPYISIFDVAQNEIIPKFSGGLVTHKIINPEYVSSRNAAKGKPFFKLTKTETESGKRTTVVKYQRNPEYRPALKDEYINDPDDNTLYKLPGYKNLNFKTIYDVFKTTKKDATTGKTIKDDVTGEDIIFDKPDSIIQDRKTYTYPQKIVDFIYIPYTIEQQIELAQVSQNAILAADKWYFTKMGTKAAAIETVRNPVRRAMGNYSLDIKHLWADFKKQDYYPHYVLKDPTSEREFPVEEVKKLDALYLTERDAIPFRPVKFDCPKFRHMLMNLLLMKTGKIFSSTGLHFQPHLRDLSGTKNLVNKYGFPIEFGQHAYDIEEFPSFIEPIKDPKTATHYYLPLVYSTSDVLGLGPFALYLESLGFKYILLHDGSEKSTIDREQMRALQKCYPLEGTKETTAPQQDTNSNPKKDILGNTLHETRVIYNREGQKERNDLEAAIKNILSQPSSIETFRKEIERIASHVDKSAPLCVLLHPDITEGVDAKHNPAILLMEPPHNFGDYEQLCGRVLRTYKSGYTIRPKKVVYQYAAYNKENLKRIYDNRFDPTIKGIIGGIDAEQRSKEGEQYFYTEKYDVNDSIYIALEKDKQELASYLPKEPFWVALRVIMSGQLDYLSSLDAEEKRLQEARLNAIFSDVTKKISVGWVEWLFGSRAPPTEQQIREGVESIRKEALDPTLRMITYHYSSGAFANLSFFQRINTALTTVVAFTGTYQKDLIYMNELIRQRVAKIKILNSNLTILQGKDQRGLISPLVQREQQARAQQAFTSQRAVPRSPEEQTATENNLVSLENAIQELNNVMIVNESPDLTRITEIAAAENEVKQYLDIMMEDKTPDITAINKCILKQREKTVQDLYKNIVWCDPFAQPIEANKYILCRPVNTMESIVIDDNTQFLQFTQLVDQMKEFINLFKPYSDYAKKPIGTLQLLDKTLKDFNTHVYGYFTGNPKNDYTYKPSPPFEKKKIPYRRDENRRAWNTQVTAVKAAITSQAGGKQKRYGMTKRKGRSKKRSTRRR